MTSELSLSEQFIEASPYCLFRFDLRRQIPTYISPNVERLWGYPAAEIFGQPDYWRSIVHPDDLPLLLSGIIQGLRVHAAQISVIYRARHITYGYRWVENTICFFYDEQFVPDYALCYVLDINDRKQAEDELRRSEDRLQRIFNTSPAGIGITSLAEGRFLYFNDSALRLTGYTQTEIVGQTNVALGFWPNTRSLGRLIHTLKRGQPVLNHEHIVNIKSGGHIHLLSSFDLLELDGQQCVINISIDITARKRAEEATRQMNRDLTSLLELGQLLANRANRGELLFRVAHTVLHIFTHSQAVVVWLYNEKHDHLAVQAWVGFSDVAMAGHVTSSTHGRIGTIFRTSQPLLIADFQNAPGAQITDQPEHGAVQSFLGVPLLSEGSIIGVLAVFSFANPQAFSPEDSRLLQSLANQVALTILNHRLFDAERSAHRLADTLRAANLAISKSLDLQVVLESLLEVLRGLVPYDSADVELVQNESQLVIVAARGYEDFNSAAKVNGMVFDLEHFRLTKRMFESRQGLLASDVNQFPDWVRLPESSHINSWLGVPIIVQGEVIGLYSVDKTERGFFTQEHLQLAEMLALPAAIAIGNARLFEEVSGNREQLRLLTHRVYLAQEEERLRLSGELHDDIGAMLTPLKSRLYKMSIEPPLDPTRIRAEMDIAMDMVDDVIQHVRRLGRDLRPPSIDAVGIGPVMDEYCRTYARHTGLFITYESHSVLPPLPGDFSIGLFRILQEALTNVVRHAQATHVGVSLELEGGTLQLTIIDNGYGFKPAVHSNSSQGIGLVGMRERVALLGGTLAVTSTPGQGVRLQASLPMPNANPAMAP